MAGDKPAPSSISAVRPREICGLFLLFLAVGFAIHCQGFNGPMIYDSKAFIQDNVAIFAQHNLRDVMGIVPVRPLFMLSLYCNFLLTGMDPFFFRLFNLVILAATGVVLALLGTLLLDLPAGGVAGTTREKKCISALIGLWFVVHPLQTLVVLYIWQREAIMACFFYFAAVAAYVGTRSRAFRRPLAGYVVTGLLFLAGLLTKENLGTVPIVLFLAELTLFRQKPRQLLRRASIIASIALPPLVLYVLVTHGMHKTDSLVPQGVIDRLFRHFQDSGLTLGQVLLTECRVFWHYLFSILVPFLTGTPLLNAETVSTSLDNPPVTVVAVAGLAALVGTGMALIRKRPLYAFGILFFVVVLTPESILVPLYLFFGYRAILPMAGVLLVLGTALLALVRWLRVKLPTEAFGIVAAALVVAPVLGLGALTFSQAGNWTPILFWKTAFDRLPPYSETVEQVTYVQVLLNYGVELLKEKDYAGAVTVLKRAAAMAPDVEESLSKMGLNGKSQRDRPATHSLPRNILKDHPAVNTSLFYLGSAAIADGKILEGIAYLKLVLGRDPGNEAARLALASALLHAGNSEEGMEQLKKAVASHPTSAGPRINLGLAYKKSGNRSGAREQFRKAVELAPSSAVAHINLAKTLEESGDLPGALESYRRAVLLMPGAPEVHYSLANALLKSGDEAEAIKEFQRAVELKPDFAEAHANLGAALLGAGRASEASISFQKALAVIKDNAELHNAMGAALAEQGRMSQAVDHFKKALALQPDHASAKENLEMLTPDNLKPSGGHGEK
jgi:protein O-mannosyl-transferase